MTGFSFRYNPASEKELARGADMALVIGRAARAVAATATRTAPHGPTGRYEHSIDTAGPRVGPHGQEAAVGSDDFAWHLVEFGSVNNRPYRVLQRATRAAGLRWEERR